MVTLRKETSEIIVRASDNLGNVATTVLKISPRIPTIEYQSISRKRNSVVIKGLQVQHFPTEAVVLVTYKWGRQTKKLGLKTEQELVGFSPVWSGTILVTAVDAGGEYQADCSISVEGKYISIK